MSRLAEVLHWAVGPRWLCALAVTAGCGRLGFDATDNSAPDVQVPAKPRVISLLGATVVHDAAFDPAGNVAVIGEYTTMISIGGLSASSVASSLDMFVAFVAPDGVAMRLWTGGVTDLASGQNLARLPDGSLVASGYFNGSLTRGGDLMSGARQAALQLRFDPAGDLVFARHYPGSGNVQFRGISATSSRVAVVGVYLGSTDLGAGALPETTVDNSFVATMDPAGGDVRSRALNATGDVFVNDIALAPNGDLCIGGRFRATTDFGAGPMSPTGQSAFVARYDSQLTLQWVRTFGSGASTANVAILATGDCVGSGEFTSLTIDGIVHPGAGDVDGWVGRFDVATGSAAWIRALAGTGRDNIPALAVHDDRIVLAATFTGSALLGDSRTLTSEGAADIVVGGFELDGAVAWTTQVGGTGDLDLGIGGMAIAPTGALAAITLAYSGELRVDGEAFPAGGGAAVVVPIPPN